MQSDTREMRWSSSEKRIARQAFKAAYDVVVADIMKTFKDKAAAATTEDEMWAVEKYLRESRRWLDEQFDYRYSVLPWVFGRLIGEGWLTEQQLTGLSDEKLAWIRREAAFVADARRGAAPSE